MLTIRKLFWRAEAPASRVKAGGYQAVAMNTYRFFALDATGRVDRGFEQRFINAAAAIEFAKHVEDAASVEVLHGREMVARVVIRNGKVSVFEGP